MCGRFSLTSDKTRLAEYFNLKSAGDYTASYNITPDVDIPVVRLQDKVNNPKNSSADLLEAVEL